MIRRVAVTWWLKDVLLRFFVQLPGAMMTSPFLDNYEPLDVIGNGFFGIIRKVCRKVDGLVRAIGGISVLPDFTAVLADIHTQGTYV